MSIWTVIGNILSPAEPEEEKRTREERHRAYEMRREAINNLAQGLCARVAGVHFGRYGGWAIVLEGSSKGERLLCTDIAATYIPVVGDMVALSTPMFCGQPSIRIEGLLVNHPLRT